MPDNNLRVRLDAAIDTLDDAQRQRLLDWSGFMNPLVRDAREAGASIGPLAERLHIANDGVTDGRAQYHLDVAADLLNPHGLLHGGAVYVMVDYSMGSATMSVLELGETCATIEIKISYLAGVRRGRLSAATEIIRRGRRIVFLESRVSDEAGKLVATASGSFAVIAQTDRS